MNTIFSPSKRQHNINNNQSTHAKHRRLVWLLLSLLIAFVLLYFSLKDLDWNTFWLTISNGHYKIIWLVIPIISFNYFLRAIRWRILIRSDKKLSIMAVFWANMVGYMGNAYLPARAGELLRCAFLGEKSGLGTSFVLATALVERLLDVITLVIVGSLALFVQGNISSILLKSIGAMAIFGLVGLIFIMLIPTQENRIMRLMNRLPSSEVVSQFLTLQIRRFLLGAQSLQSGSRLGGFVFMTGIIWLIDAFGITLCVRIISQNLQLDQAFVLLAALGLSSAIPSTPGYIGVYQFVALLVLVPFGYSQTEALAYILIAQMLGYVVISFWGVIGLFQINRMKKNMVEVK